MSRAFGASATSSFDITLSHGFDMPSGADRVEKMLRRASTNPSGSRKLVYDGSRGRGVTEDGILTLAEQLNLPSTNIEGLVLRYVDLSDQACQALASAMKVNWTLRRFEIHGVCTVFLGCASHMLTALWLRQASAHPAEGTMHSPWQWRDTPS